MDGDWEEVVRLPLPPPGLRAAPTPVGPLCFDTKQELLWIGNDYGRVSSFYNSELQRYTSFKAGDGPVRQILSHEKGVIALGARSVHMAMRRGAPLWHISLEDMKDLQCMSFTSKGTSEILVAGLQDQMFVIDVEKGKVIKQVTSGDHYMIMKRSRYICAATSRGSVNILDPTTFGIVKTWDAHSSLISDMDAQHDFIVTCGYSMRPQQTYMLDSFVNVFDLKKLTSLSPIPFPAGAAFVRMHPRMSTTAIVVSQLGQMHVVDLMNVNTSNVRQANVMTCLTRLEIAPSGEAIALADGEFNVQLWGSPLKIQFAEFNNPVEFADVIEDSTQIDWSVDSPLSTIGMPYYREQLLSAWPSHMIFEIGGPPPKADPHSLRGLKNTEWGAYGTKARNVRRNQVENTRATEKASTSLQAPKFLSEKARDSNDTNTERRISDVADAIGAMEMMSLKMEVPLMYRNVEIKISKFGVDDFDFGFYNKTLYSGLENHISNSYANALLQLMHFTPLVRNFALQHTAMHCLNDMCLLCELGFLFDMLEKAEGSICQATNMLKVFSKVPQAVPLGLLEENGPGSSLSIMLQGLNRFLMEKIVQDYRMISPHSPAFEQVLTTSATTAIRCTNCRSEHTRPGTTCVNELLYPPPKPSVRGRGPAQKSSFSQVLKFSVERETASRGWCNRCQRYQSLTTKKTIHSIPLVFMLNASINTAEAKQYWSTPGWLPEEIGIIIDQGQFFCYEGNDLKMHLQRGVHNITVYSLIGLAADIESEQAAKSHLVSFVNVGHSQHTPPGKSQWHLFNDFLIRPITTEEALTFNTAWKLPSVITYQVKSAVNGIDDSWKQKIDTSLLYMDFNTNPGEKTYIPLTIQEAPTSDTILALDTEFVAIQQPEIEVNSDGERETIRPIVYALARVSAVRGAGEAEGVPFIDDYIASKEPIVDYLTSYSGIVHGDLDPRLSKHNLVSLKIAYKKLWILLNLGCKFLGHGLKQDFRVANIHVPASQVIDTISFFHISARRRKLSLAFLAWFFLKEDIQLETHDSIEDARTALKLYRKATEFLDAGIMENMLEEVYRVGREYGFKPPPKVEGGKVIERSETPTLLADGSSVGPSASASGPSTPIRKADVLAPPGTAGLHGASEGWISGKASPLK